MEGQVYRRPALADTLEQLAEAGDGLADLFYRGALGRQLVAEVSIGLYIGLYRRPALADTLEQLAEAGDGLADLFYRGAIGRQLVAEVSENSLAKRKNIWRKFFPKYSRKFLWEVRQRRL